MQEMQETQFRSLGWEDALEKEMATHPSVAGIIPWTEEPGRLQFVGSQRIRHDWAGAQNEVRRPVDSHLACDGGACRLWGRTESDMTEAT